MRDGNKRGKKWSWRALLMVLCWLPSQQEHNDRFLTRINLCPGKWTETLASSKIQTRNSEIPSPAWAVQRANILYGQIMAYEKGFKFSCSLDWFDSNNRIYCQWKKALEVEWLFWRVLNGRSDRNLSTVRLQMVERSEKPLERTLEWQHCENIHILVDKEGKDV